MAQCMCFSIDIRHAVMSSAADGHQCGLQYLGPTTFPSTHEQVSRQTSEAGGILIRDVASQVGSCYQLPGGRHEAGGSHIRTNQRIRLPPGFAAASPLEYKKAARLSTWETLPPSLVVLFAHLTDDDDLA